MGKAHQTAKERQGQECPNNHRQDHHDVAGPVAYSPYLAGITPGESHTDSAKDDAKIARRQIEHAIALLVITHFV